MDRKVFERFSERKQKKRSGVWALCDSHLHFISAEQCAHSSSLQTVIFSPGKQPISPVIETTQEKSEKNNWRL